MKVIIAGVVAGIALTIADFVMHVAAAEKK